MSVTWRRVKPLVDINSVDSLLDSFNLKISDSLKACILANNGAKLTPNAITLPGGSEFDVKCLLSYNTEDAESIHNVIRYFVDSYHGDLVPFAVDSGSNYYCENNGKVVFWIQDADIIKPVAENFMSFLLMIHE